MRPLSMHIVPVAHNSYKEQCKWLLQMILINSMRKKQQVVSGNIPKQLASVSQANNYRGQPLKILLKSGW